MIWYLLYPLRGTTEAPDLSPSNPLRIAFTRYGTYISQHVVLALFISGIVATILIYPIPYLFTDDFTNGASNLPHHVWTAAQPLGKSVIAAPDIIMRSIWIHGDYMSALNTDLLTSALELQNELLGSTENFSPSSSRGYTLSETLDWPMAPNIRDSVHIVNGLTNQSWFFHSPLLYWHCSLQQILADHDLIATVNEKKTQSTSANVTLRHSIVFSGKRYSERRLLAADALVITLLHLGDSPVGRQWEHNAPLLAQKTGAKWDIYPQNGKVQESQLYEFQFRPMSPYDIIIFVVAYSLASIHFLTSLSKLRAIKSKTGLIITVTTKVAFSVMSSFTVCAVCDIDLSRIPRAAYPFVVLTTSLENMLRLIHAVILTPSENSTSSRVGSAFGQTAHISLVSTLQNAAILACLSRVVSPGVGALCIFAAIATIFDFFYLSTFFLSVLSVDVRRIELEDALSKASAVRHNRSFCDTTKEGPWCISNIWRRKIALSTRIAGTVVMISFVVIAQWHFFGHVGMLEPARQLFGASLWSNQQGTESSSPLEEIHQARSPGSWLRLQDHETAQEVIRAIKPSAYSYTAKVFDPLVFVLKNSNRTPPRTKQRLLPAAYDFIDHQLAQFLITIVLVGAGLRLLASYLLWVDEEAMDSVFYSHTEDSLLSIKTLSGGHVLDVVMIVASADGRIVTAGLDRIIRVWDIRSREESYELPGTRTLNGRGLFPILGMALDAESRWLAVMSATQVRVWDLSRYVWSELMAIETAHHRPEVFCFHPKPKTSAPRLIIAWKDGTMLDLSPGNDQQHSDVIIRTEQLLMACPLISKDQLGARTLSIVSLSRNGKASLTRETGSGWDFKNLPLDHVNDTTLHQIVPLSPQPLFLIGSVSSVYLVSAIDGAVQHRFTTEPMISRSIRCEYSGSRYGGIAQSGIGLANFTIGYMAADTQSCAVINYRPSEGSEAIAACAPPEGIGGGWCAWKEAIVSKKQIGRPGAWEIVKGKSIVGMRAITTSHSSKPEVYRRRSVAKNRDADDLVKWQVWTAATDGHPEADQVRDLFKEESDREELWVVPGLGPKAKVGATSVAFCLGNTIKVVSAGGHGRYDDDDDGVATMVAKESRRGRHGGSMRTKL